ncbi:DNA polymerase III subunit epsilon [Nitrincola tibetensis]|uniref:DNA polymerase III subunit epsilon n=1 Tax=Nitrincola tibetensis TaxID=2219697 RepID=A0A364NJI2_9GAMM|nr:DNA polymerase III subunit epsilon [Nitrincola tibetensis]RAU17278.1 DNA polymerase III subunit epsilon [Nitrincola tibetensis]
MRQIILDTETTGIDPAQGHNIIEIGCVELVKRRLTNNYYHQYVRPDREAEAEAIAVHGITNEFLADKPSFKLIADEFIEYVRGAELIIHNAAFDIGFLDTELARNGYDFKIKDICPKVTDTLLVARKKFPGQKNSLDALCRRYGIEHFDRELHGALLDSKILAEVYLMLTGGQTALQLGSDLDNSEEVSAAIKPVIQGVTLPVIQPTLDEIEAHEKMLALLDKKSGGACLWKQLEGADANG